MDIFIRITFVHHAIQIAKHVNTMQIIAQHAKIIIICHLQILVVIFHKLLLIKFVYVLLILLIIMEYVKV